jgi:hypothetical protein
MDHPCSARFIALFLACSIAALPLAAASATGKTLQRVSGNVGYKLNETSPFVVLAGDIALADNAVAVTQARSTAKVLLEESSTIGLGQNTSVRLGAFNAGVTAGSVITINNGAMRFNITHPSGAQSNYRFVTPTAQLSVRGTSGLIGSGPNGDDIACVQCDPGDAVVTVGTVTYPLLSGQTAHITTAGIVTVSTTPPQLGQFFEQQGLSMDPQTVAVFSGTFSNLALAVVPAATAPLSALAIIAGAIIGIFVSSEQKTTTSTRSSSGTTLTISSHGNRPVPPQRPPR